MRKLAFPKSIKRKSAHPLRTPKVMHKILRNRRVSGTSLIQGRKAKKIVSTAKFRKNIVEKHRKELIATLQPLVQKFCRLRDIAAGFSCIDGCGRNIKDGGHFIPVKSCSFLRFDERNINGQNGYCNRFEYGRKEAQRAEIDRRWGVGTANLLEQLKREHPNYKWPIEVLEEKIAYYTNKLKINK